MVNVSDEAAQKAAADREADTPPPDTAIGRARREFFHELISIDTPAFRLEMRKLDGPMMPAEPIADLDPRVAVALVAAYREDSAALPSEVRHPMYVAWGRLEATAELVS
jgi:hypothetical protein